MYYYYTVKVQEDIYDKTACVLASWNTGIYSDEWGYIIMKQWRKKNVEKAA